MTDISMIAQLREFGFTESEAKVYVALLEGGAGKRVRGEQTLGRRRSKIYTILEALHPARRGAQQQRRARDALPRGITGASGGAAARRDGSGAAQPRTRRRGARLRPE